MSRVHSLLSSGSWKGADLRELIRDQLLQGPVDETRVTAWGPAVHLEPQSAQHLALMLHELGTNSMKYGALSKSDGYLTISWTVADALLHLCWVERGGSPVSAPVRRGFGTTVIEQSARSEGGDARMILDGHGLTWEISMSLQHTQSSPKNTTTPDMVRESKPPEKAFPDQSASFAGKRFLIVEDEPLVALDLVTALERLGAEALGPAGTSEQALAVIENECLNGVLLMRICEASRWMI
jgi:hypothetical protein